MNFAEQLPEHSRCWSENGSEEENESEEELTDVQFDHCASQSIVAIGNAISFLTRVSWDVQNLVVSHLDKLTSILVAMETRNYPRSEIVSSGLSVLMDSLENWTSPNNVLESFFADCDLDYFLHHANEQRLLLGSGPFRLPDLLLVVILSGGEWNSSLPGRLKTVLKYGVSPNHSSQHFRQSWDGHLLMGCVGSQALLKFGGTLCRHKDDENNAEREETTRAVGELLSAAVSPESRSLLRKRSQAEFGLWFDEEKLKGVLRAETVGRAVPSLRQLCRTWIRRMLHQSWSLPDGIQQLDVPLHLKTYLNLET